MATKPISVRKIQLETKCCRAKPYFEIGFAAAGGFHHCGGCGRWCPELQVVREVERKVPAPRPQSRLAGPDRSYVEPAPKSLAVRHDFVAAARPRQSRAPRTPVARGRS